MDWSGYEPYDPPHWGPLRELGRKEARESFEDIMLKRQDRREALVNLLQVNGVILSSDDEGLRRLQKFFDENVEASASDLDRLQNGWYGLVTDISLFLGDCMIDRFPGLRWEMWVRNKRDASYQQHVVVGFTTPTDHHVDVDASIATRGHRLIKSMSVPPEGFIDLFRGAARRA